MKRRKFLMGAASCALIAKVPAIVPEAPLVTLEAAPLTASAFEEFNQLMMRRICEAYALPYEAIVGEIGRA